MMRVSDLLKAKIRTESGEKVGHVFDLRVERDPRSSTGSAGQKWALKGLVVGEAGLVERYGFARATHPKPVSHRDVIPWSAVLRVGQGEVVVRDGARPG